MADEDERRRTQQIAIVTILEAKTHYQVLSLSSTASQDEIRNSYIYLSRLVHPDKCHLPKSTEAFQRLSSAYETLKNIERRQRYDSTGEDNNENLFAQEVFEQMANQLLNDFMEGNFQNIGELIDILNMSNPDLHLDKQNFEKFLSDLRTGMESVNKTMQDFDSEIVHVKNTFQQLTETKSFVNILHFFEACISLGLAANKRYFLPNSPLGQARVFFVGTFLTIIQYSLKTLASTFQIYSASPLPTILASLFTFSKTYVFSPLFNYFTQPYQTNPLDKLQ